MGSVKSNGAILWSGPSLLDGAPIVVIAIGLASGSSNRKTGDMLQTYILRADMLPQAAINCGGDVSICGDCSHRGNRSQGVGRTCYVNIGQGPTVVYKTYKRGGYPVATDVAAVGANRIVRLGTYGDPAAVPVAVWDALVSNATAHTGYTHQWKQGTTLRHLCMASADSSKEASVAHVAGWRTFRVAMPNHIDRLPSEAICPASEEAGRKLTCDTCRACSGANGRRGSIVIRAHGGTAVMANVKRLAA
jgi:hypothetical protein